MMSSKRSHKLLLLHFAIFCLLLLQENCTEANVILCKESERKTLLEFKQSLQAVDSSGNDVLSSWKSKECCVWVGVSCNNLTGYVEKLDFRSKFKDVAGTISSSLLKLHHLRLLDLSYNDFNGSVIPEFFGSLKKLRYLDLSNANFGGSIPSNLGNLSMLETFRLGGNGEGLFYRHNIGNMFTVGKLEWLSHLSFLRGLDLSFVSLSSADDWSQVINKLPFLEELSLSHCDLPSISPSFSFTNFSTSLTSLDLSGNSLTSSSIYQWLFNVSSNLVSLDLSMNQLKGPIPEAFGNMITMQELYLSHNQLEGEIFKSFGNMCSLAFLDMESNHLSTFGIVQNTSLSCTRYSLRELSLAHNQLKGNSVLNEITKLPSLSVLDLGYNLLNGTIKESIGQLPNLKVLRLAGNAFDNVVISEAHFSNLTKLRSLDLSYSYLTLKISSGWSPPFQLGFMLLCSCKIGPRFPIWLRTQTALVFLDISASEISDSLPDWFWNSVDSLVYLNMSFNQINGTLPHELRYKRHLDLSSNNFTGPLPMSLYSLWSLNLSKNKFTGSVSAICNIMEKWSLYLLDLSYNVFSREVPGCIAEFVRLKVLNLADNSLSGPVPSSLGSLASLEMLSLRGEIPKWIGQSLSSLVFLSLRRNQFKRKMPHQLCGLKYVQILDLSLNNISGSLPSCFNNFTSMAQKLSLDQRIEHVFRKFFVIPFDPKYVDEALLTWKGTKQRNSLIGKIPQKIGQLRQLEVLDLSRNKFSSNIPTSLSELTFLSTLDLSYNYLSGKIPTGRQLQLFDPSSYSHNQGLCGPPVSPDCSMVEPPQVEHTREGEEDSINEFMKWFYTGTGLGFAVGFWGFCSVVFFKRSWRHSYYRFLDNTKDWLYVSFILMKTSLMKRIKALPTSCRRSG
ncbi:receptor-like protein EIX1 isoform X2 [Gossypium arboreum]|uniref:receptor-like protein EIX1 isoform X2 n=1 Tax=Gossypium arboreum TaxID=29729 RepID=UPI0022F1D50D|nr:receptor-like protein EIX1 isoform X2 [Gossypium arboreum]